MLEEHKRLLEDFIYHLKINGYSRNWTKRANYFIPPLLAYFNERGMGVNQVKVKDVYDYRKWLMEKRKQNGNKYNEKTINGVMLMSGNFFKFLKSRHIIKSSPFLEVKQLRTDLKLPRNILKEKEMNIFLKEIAKYDEEELLTNKITRYKVHVVSELMYSTGLRATEISNLRVQDIDFENGIVQVIGGKGGKNRIAFLNEYALRILKLYVNEMRGVIFNVWNKRNDNLFGAGHECFGKYVNVVFKKISTRLGFKVFTSHCFRHSVGYHLLRSGCDIRYIQAILGHEQLKTTEIYTKVDKEDLRGVLDKYHPRQWRQKENEKVDVQMGK